MNVHGYYLPEAICAYMCDKLTATACDMNTATAYDIMITADMSQTARTVAGGKGWGLAKDDSNELPKEYMYTYNTLQH